MDIHDFLKDRQGLIDRTLERYLRGWKQHPKNLYKAMHYSVFSGGKRLRPILTLAVGELFGAKSRVLLPFACTLELIHTYSLIHDDLPALDNDDLRRGKLTSHKLFGEGIALLSGDALLTEAFHLMTRPQSVRALDCMLVVELVREISHAAGVDGLVGGQAVDLEVGGQTMDIATVEYIHARKTGALFLTAARVGAKIGRAAPKDLRRISRYAERLGLAFQITDDILDAGNYSGEAKQSENHNDNNNKEAEKATYPSVAGLHTARARVRELLKNCLKEVESFGIAADPLRGIAQFVVERAV
jgi:geranylgeranyl diphosphate synthase type II